MTGIAPGDIILVDFGPVMPSRKQASKRPGMFLYEEGGVALVVPFTSNVKRLREVMSSSA